MKINLTRIITESKGRFVAGYYANKLNSAYGKPLKGIGHNILEQLFLAKLYDIQTIQTDKQPYNVASEDVLQFFNSQKVVVETRMNSTKYVGRPTTPLLRVATDLVLVGVASNGEEFKHFLMRPAKKEQKAQITEDLISLKEIHYFGPIEFYDFNKPQTTFRSIKQSTSKY